MGHWDDVSAVRAALQRGLHKQLASDFRHDRHGEVFLVLGADEREQVLVCGDVARNKVRAREDPRGRGPRRGIARPLRGRGTAARRHGAARSVRACGALADDRGLPSAGASADYHPGLGLLVVGTYAGQLHVFDARRGADVGTQDGWTRGGDTAGLREMRRWLLWPQLAGGSVAW